MSLTIPFNKQNSRIWTDLQPEVVIEKALHDEKVLVWWAFSSTNIYGPYFFCKSLNQYSFLEMLKDLFWPRIKKTA